MALKIGELVRFSPPVKDCPEILGALCTIWQVYSPEGPSGETYYTVETVPDRRLVTVSESELTTDLV
jgi:hypothetical protein